MSVDNVFATIIPDIFYSYFQLNHSYISPRLRLFFFTFFFNFWTRFSWSLSRSYKTKSGKTIISSFQNLWEIIICKPRIKGCVISLLYNLSCVYIWLQPQEMNLIACAHFYSLFLLCFRINTIITTQRDKVASLSLSTEDIGQPICWSNPSSPYLPSRFSSSTPWIHALNGSINGPLTVYVYTYTLLLLLLPLQTREHLSFNLLEL